MPSLLVSLFAACTSPSSGPAADTARPAARDDLLVLSVGDVTTGKPVAFRVTGTQDANVGIVRGDPGGTSCPPDFQGACFDLLNVKLVTTVQATPDGLAITSKKLPRSVVTGAAVIGFQAVVTDGLGQRTSRMVERVPVTKKAFQEPVGGNVLIVLLDDVGVDRIALYGAPLPAQTPVIDSLAADGMVFDNAWSMPLCGPTRATIQTGLMPRRTGYGKNQSAESDITELDPDFTTIAELVEHSPDFVYSTSYLGKWHLVSVSSPSGPLGPKVQGWDFWTGTINAVAHWVGPNDGVKPSYFHYQLTNDQGLFEVSDEYATSRTTDDAIARVGAMAEPWVMQVAYNASHEPFHIPPPELIHTPLDVVPDNASLHRAMTEAADTEIGRLLDAIPVDVRGRTTIFVLGDNGTPGPAADPWENPDRTKASVYDGGVHVPFVVNGPLIGVPGSRSKVLVNVVDLFPTIAEVTGVHVDDLPNADDPALPLTVDGVSLVPVLWNPKVKVRATNFAEKFAPGGGGPFDVDKRTARNDQYKLIVDVACASEMFFEYLPGVWDEGPDLIPLGPLTADQEAGRAGLRAEIDAKWASLPYEADTWQVGGVLDTICPPGGDTGDTGLGHTGDTGLGHTGDTGVVVPPPPEDTGP